MVPVGASTYEEESAYEVPCSRTVKASISVAAAADELRDIQHYV
jgi:hypothetical protein